MQIKRYEAKDIQGALKQIKEELGPEAIILSTKTVKKPFQRLGFPSSSWIEVVAAMDRPSHSTSELPSPPSSRSISSKTTGEHSGYSGEGGFLQRMLSIGLYPEFVYGVAEEIKGLEKELTGEKLTEAYRGLLHWKLMEKVEVSRPSFLGAKIWSFIGPTGVGKTTTMVKLAAQMSVKVTPKITLITLDTYRIGAVEQLRSFAQILRLPLEIALHPEELKQIIERNRDQDLLLIDTAGRSPNHEEHLKELKDFLSVDPHIENHLILSATTKDDDLDTIVQRFRLLPIASYMFTKIDETGQFVPLFNQLLRYQRPLSFLTKGQRVPEDIEAATKIRVANLVLNTIPWN